MLKDNYKKKKPLLWVRFATLSTSEWRGKKIETNTQTCRCPRVYTKKENKNCVQLSKGLSVYTIKKKNKKLTRVY